MFSRFFACLAIVLLIASCQKKPGDTSQTGSSTPTGTYEHDSGSYEGSRSPAGNFYGLYNVNREDLEPFALVDAEKDRRNFDRVFFEFDSSSLTPMAQEILDRQAKWLKANSNQTITIEGHCDERGTREYNLALGDRRANSVRRYLINSGISSNRIRTLSYGKERPVVIGSDEATHAENRRAVSTLNR